MPFVRVFVIKTDTKHCNANFHKIVLKNHQLPISYSTSLITCKFYESTILHTKQNVALSPQVFKKDHSSRHA